MALDPTIAVIARILNGEQIYVTEDLIWGAYIGHLRQGVERGIWEMQTAIHNTLSGEEAADPGTQQHAAAVQMQGNYRRFNLSQAALRGSIMQCTEDELYNLFCIVWNHVSANTMVIGGTRVVSNT